MKKLIIGIMLVLLLLPIFSYAQTTESTAVMRDLNERLERNKAELIKEINDVNKQNEELIKDSIDENFAVLDERMDKFFKNATRDVAIIMVAGFLLGFTISQIVKIKIETKKRKELVRRKNDLEIRVNELVQDVDRLTKVVSELKSMDKKYSSKLKSFKKPKFFNIRVILFGVASLIVGALITFMVVRL